MKYITNKPTKANTRPRKKRSRLFAPIQSNTPNPFPTELLIILALLGLFVGAGLLLRPLSVAETIILAITTLLATQGALSTYSMLYSFLNENRLKKTSAKRDNAINLYNPQRKFSFIVAARNEERVIGQTLKSMAKIDYPENLLEVIVLVRADDTKTIEKVESSLSDISRKTFRLIKIDGDATNKAYSLNIGAHFATGDIIAIFDAEDEPHPQILNQVNSAFIRNNSDIIQAPIQLINISSSWFSALNCLEYYFWFKSVLPFLSKLGATPLGGNSIFFKREVIKAIDQWDEACLTEDADIGIRASTLGYQIDILYLESIATLEESPKDEIDFIRQRTRWDQGFLQVLAKKDWLKLNSPRQKFITLYILSQSLFRHIGLINMIMLPIIASLVSTRVPIAMLSLFPAYFLILQISMYFLGLMDLGKSYNLSVSPLTYLKTVLGFFPYQAMLAISSTRAIFRHLTGQNVWEKTNHYNLHRQALTATS